MMKKDNNQTKVRKLRAENALNVLKKGDHIYIYRSYGIYTHHGLYLGDNKVIQYSGFGQQLGGGPVEIVTIDTFSQGRPIYIKQYALKHRRFSPDLVVQRALSRLGENHYSIFNNNCEHFVYWCITGKHRSRQVQRTILTLNTNVGLYLINGCMGETVASLTIFEIFYNNIIMALLLVFAMAISMQAGITLLNSKFLYYRLNQPVSDIKARYLGRNIATIVGFLLTFLSMIFIDMLGDTQALDQNSLYSGLEVLGHYFSGGYKVGIFICALTPFFATVAVGLFVYYLFSFRLQRSQSTI